MKRLLPAFSTAAGSIILGLVLGWLAESAILPNPIFSASYQINLAGLASRLGVAVAVLVVGFFLVKHNIQRVMEQKQHEVQAEQISARQRFFQRLDHELKNPLTIIRLGLVNLQQSSNLNIEQFGSLERISQQVQRLQKLVIDLRLLSELESVNIERKAVDLKELLEEVIDLARETAEPGRSVVLNLQRTPWPVSNVSGDRDLLVLAFRNLLDNALKFSKLENQVEVRVTEDGRVAIVDVADTGLGIPPEDLPHVFEELYRGQNAHGIPGSGLGLKLVERIIALHEGTVQVRSKPELGTVFTVRLALAPETTT